MKKEEIEHKLEQARIDRDLAHIQANKEIDRLKEQLAESEKPKLRHGDFGINYTDHRRITLFRNGNDGGKRDDYCPFGRVTDSEITVFGNVFDLMKEWSEPFEYYHSEKGHNYDDDKDLEIVIDINDCRPDKIWIGTCGNSAWYSLKAAEKIHNALGHAIAELKRKENK